MNEDPLWPHFKPLWTDLVAIDTTNMIVAGGYGLYLKQKWILQLGQETKLVIPVERWNESAPRATGDMDLVLGLDLISQQQLHQDVLKVLDKNSFEVSKKESGKRWQFIKAISEDGIAKLEFHCQLPTPGDENLAVTKTTVKHKPSLGDGGIHGRKNPEAVGSELHPSQFQLEGLNIKVVNPVTWSVMKLTAMHDQWEKANQGSLDQKQREFSRAQSLKHAHDVCRLVAMTTEKENSHAKEVISIINGDSTFAKAKTFLNEQFVGERAINEPVKRNWQPDDFETINAVLQGWFKLV